MDPMESDDTVFVLDTPDRLSKQIIDERNNVKGKSRISPTSLHSVQRKFFHEGSEINPMVIDSGSRKLPSRPPKFTSSSSNSESPINSSKNAPLFRKGMTNNTPIHKTRDSISTSSKPSSRGGTFVNPMERELFKPDIGRNGIQVGVPGTGRPGLGKRPVLANGPSSSSSYGKEKVEFDENIQNIPAVSRQKRLVRNGCISPNNIAKGKQLAVREGVSGISHDDDDFTMSNGQSIPITIRELVTEEISRNGKGKGVINYPVSSNETDAKNKHMGNRSSVSFNEKGKGKSIEEVDERRSMRNRTNKTNVSRNNEEICPIQHQEIRPARIERGKDVNLPLRPTVSHHRARLGSSSNGHQSAASSTLTKRRKPVGSTLSGCGECSSLVPNDQEVLFLSSSNSRLNSSNNVNNLEPIIEVDEFSPQLRRNLIDEEARLRQLEADEAMARELQEQLYSEGPPNLGDPQADEYVALSLQNPDEIHRYFASANHPVPELQRNRNTRRPSHSRTVSNVSGRVPQPRSSPSGRMTRLRSNFPGRPRTLLTSRGRAPVFPENMDIDLRMHILGALEAGGDIGFVPGILEAQRDFNESDYETLLALDEHNDAHGGAPIHRINSLPQSTVQNNNFDEVCAVCLETPAIGDTIRHLPCFHKFHKDCIDPWLRRKTSCPICKSSVT